MENLIKNELRLNLLKRSTKILEKTKYDFKNYEAERHNLLKFTQEIDPNYSLWEHMVKDFESVIALDEKLNLLKKDIEYLKKLSINLKEQKTRENADIDNIYLFEIVDKFNNHMQFIARENAETHMKVHTEDFNNTNEIYIIENKNEDLKFLLNLIERNF